MFKATLFYTIFYVLKQKMPKLISAVPKLLVTHAS